MKYSVDLDLICDRLYQLVLKHQEHFKGSGEREELDASIFHARIALGLRPRGHADRPKICGSLGLSLCLRMNPGGEMEDIDPEDIEVFRTALEIIPEHHFLRGMFQTFLAMALRKRSELYQHRQTEDLSEAIELNSTALALFPEGHHLRSGCVSNLAGLLEARFRQDKQIGDLDKAIELYRDSLKLRTPALELQPERYLYWSSLLHGLARSLESRFEQNGRVEDLDEAIGLFCAALDILPTNHPRRSILQNDFAASLRTRFKLHHHKETDSEDLEKTIALNRAALEHCPKGHSDHSSSLKELAISLFTRFNWHGRTEDLNEAITLNRAALEVCREGHHDCYIHLNNLAASLIKRFTRLGQIVDLDEAIELNRAALDCRPDGYSDHSSSMNNLAVSLITRFKQKGRIEDLDEAIELLRSSLEYFPKAHPDRSSLLKNLASCLSTRFGQHSRMEDLEEAIELERAALELLSETDPLRSLCMNGLACNLAIRFQFIEQSREVDLDEAIELLRAALELVPKGHPNHSMYLNNLANSLRVRFEQHNWIEDVDKVIALHRVSTTLYSESHLDRSDSLSSLGCPLQMQLERHERLEDLNEAIALHRAVLELHPEGHPDHAMSMSNLAHSLQMRFEQHERIARLKKAIAVQSVMMGLHPDSHPDRSMSLNSLTRLSVLSVEAVKVTSGESLSGLEQGGTGDLEEAIELHRAALELCPEGHPDRSGSLNLFHFLLFSRFNKFGLVEDFEECVQVLESAAEHEFSSSLIRLESACIWATLAHTYDHPTTSKAYKLAMLLLQRVLIASPTLYAQHDFLRARRKVDFKALTLDAVAYAIEGDRLEEAVELLEQGRGLLWSQMRGFRTTVDQLMETNKELAERFRSISCQLESLATSSEGLVPGFKTNDSGSVASNVDTGQKCFDRMLKLKRQLSKEQEELINEIRRIPGFESFLAVTQFKVLQQAASEGPVIVINHSIYRSDAIIILSREDVPIVCVPLDAEFYDDSIELYTELLTTRIRFTANSTEYNRKLVGVMKMLWDRVVSKVVDKLKDYRIAEGSRIWWCPTSVLSAPPFHAAGPFEDTNGTPKYLLDEYISSYTPTLGALINARSGGNGGEPTLACYQGYLTSVSETGGFQHPKLWDKVSDRGLTLLDIVRANLPDAEFAFLSACHTAEQPHGGAHDEVLHLAAAMQFSGFRSVIGSMWELLDEDGPFFAKTVYGHMLDCDEDEARFKRAAAGLRKAAVELRARDGIQTERWVNLIHIGV
ncbi:TPR-like protein [Fomitiporia mediterranea MF3/22]|uniref:TPR-like protein n=1 Tax=Fomitiporia mediterranea (strain MF3/22) TaxID=694068 RepID=UPI000440780D|nr:TPR-like protein [Fomitiporia mediterranea MF3/22]EJC98970.1 TPR-like protein [Fomitiporia mediterranea MF3/22]